MLFNMLSIARTTGNVMQSDNRQLKAVATPVQIENQKGNLSPKCIYVVL